MAIHKTDVPDERTWLTGLVRTACAVLSATPELRIEYIEAVDSDSLAPIPHIERAVVLAIAAHVGKTRLIDNAVFSPLPS